MSRCSTAWRGRLRRQSGLIIPENIPGDDLKPWKLEEACGHAAHHRDVVVGAGDGGGRCLGGSTGSVGVAAGSDDLRARSVRRVRRLARSSASSTGCRMRWTTSRQLLRPIKTDVRADQDGCCRVPGHDPLGREGLDLGAGDSGVRIRFDGDGCGRPWRTREPQTTSSSTCRVGASRTRLSGGRVQILAHWTQSSEHIDQNNALMDRLADAYTKLQNAEADCANAINQQRDLCMVDVEYIEAWQLKQSGENTVVLPWGISGRRGTQLRRVVLVGCRQRRQRSP